MLSAEMHGIFQHIISRDCSRVLGLDAHFSRSTLTERNLGFRLDVNHESVDKGEALEVLGAARDLF